MHCEVWQAKLQCNIIYIHMLLANEWQISICLILLCKQVNFKTFKNLVGQ